MSLSRMIGFKAHPQLADALQSAAARERIPVSSIVRSAVEDRLARDAADYTAQATGDPIFSRLASAARGSRESQRALALAACERVRTDDGSGNFDPETCLMEGLVFARLAAAQGDIGDQGLVIAMLAMVVTLRGEEHSSDELGEAVARLALVADSGGEGCDLIADHLPALAGQADALTMVRAKEYQARIGDMLVAGDSK